VFVGYMYLSDIVWEWQLPSSRCGLAFMLPSCCLEAAVHHNFIRPVPSRQGMAFRACIRIPFPSAISGVLHSGCHLYSEDNIDTSSAKARLHKHATVIALHRPCIV